MSWESVTWRPLDATSLPATASLTEIAGIVRSAIEEALAAERGTPIALVRADVAECSAADLPADFVPLASVELVGAPRRLVLAAWEASDADVAPDPAATGNLVLRAVDDAVAAVAGEGLGLGPAEGSAFGETAEVVAVRLSFEAADQPLGALVLVAEAAAPAELAAHVAALRALGAAAAEAGVGSDPAATPTGSATESVPGSATESAAEPPGGRRSAPAPEAETGPAIRSVALPDLGGPAGPSPSQPEAPRSIDLLLGVQLQVSVEIGRTRLPIRDVLALAPGSIVELDKLAGEKADILVNGHPVAQGEVVVVDENFGVRITDVVSRQRRILSADGAA